MRKSRKSQTYTEYMIVIGIGLAVIAAFMYYLFAYSSAINNNTASNLANNIVNTIVSEANYVSSQGVGSISTFPLQFGSLDLSGSLFCQNSITISESSHSAVGYANVYLEGLLPTTTGVYTAYAKTVVFNGSSAVQIGVNAPISFINYSYKTYNNSKMQYIVSFYNYSGSVLTNVQFNLTVLSTSGQQMQSYLFSTGATGTVNGNITLNSFSNAYLIDIVPSGYNIVSPSCIPGKKPLLNLFLNSIEDVNNSIVYGTDANFTASTIKIYVGIYVNGVLVAPLAKNYSTNVVLRAAGTYKVTAFSNLSGVNNITFWEIIDKAVPILTLTLPQSQNTTFNRVLRTTTFSITTVNNQLFANMSINNSLIYKNILSGTASKTYMGSYLYNLSTNGNQNYTPSSIARVLHIWNPMLPITFANAQNVPTLSDFQQNVTINSSAYGYAESKSLTNVYFMWPNGSVVDSWLEHGGSNASKSSLYWLKVGTIPALSTKTVFMVIQNPNLNDFNKLTTGESALLSPIYGEYDDGASVFDLLYSNFTGPSAPSGWTSASVTINHGVYLPASTSVNEFIDSNSYFGANTTLDWLGNFTEAAKRSYTVNGLYYSSNPTSSANYAANGWLSQYTSNYSWGYTTSGSSVTSTHYNVAYNTPDLFTVSNNGKNAVYSLNYSNMSKEYALQSEAQAPATADNYVEFTNTGGTGGFAMTLKWARIRDFPPNGVMPSGRVGKTYLYLNGVLDGNSSITGGVASNFTATLPYGYVGITLNGLVIKSLSINKTMYTSTLSAGTYKITAFTNNTLVRNVTYWQTVS